MLLWYVGDHRTASRLGVPRPWIRYDFNPEESSRIFNGCDSGVSPSAPPGVSFSVSQHSHTRHPECDFPWKKLAWKETKLGTLTTLPRSHDSA